MLLVIVWCVAVLLREIGRHLVAAPSVVVPSVVAPLVASLLAAQTAALSAAGLDQRLQARRSPWLPRRAAPSPAAGLCVVR